jgi:hypothetical protein
MNIKDIKVGQLVHDRWWPLHGGVVEKVLKTRVRVYFCYGCYPRTVTYDKAHCQFLVKE